jgi:hypothetical protein
MNQESIQMMLFTVEVAGRPVLTFSEADPRAAEEALALTIGPDLLEFEENGGPVWDGTAELSVREAMPEEIARWEQGAAEARQADSGEQDPEGFGVFLIDIDADTETDMDED